MQRGAFLKEFNCIDDTRRLRITILELNKRLGPIVIRSNLFSGRKLLAESDESPLTTMGILSFCDACCDYYW